MRTPTFDGFNYLNGKINSEVNKGYYKISINRENNQMTKNIKTYIIIKQLSGFGGNFGVVSKAYFFTAFVLLLALLTISYIHRLKFKEDTQENP